MKTSIKNKTLITCLLLASATFFILSCSEDDPKKEDVPELITRATLTFTPEGGGDAVIVNATDPDGDGVQPITIDGDIQLTTNKTYILTLTFSNTLVSPSDPAYDVTAEIEEEGDEHMFFFGWTNNVFSDPDGDGNIDNRQGAVNYTGGDNALDENGLPLGLTTTWTTASSNAEGDFELILKHQPGIKTENSGSDIGETDLMLSFPIIIEE
jgi:hypothetical protein